MRGGKSAAGGARGGGPAGRRRGAGGRCRRRAPGGCSHQPSRSPGRAPGARPTCHAQLGASGHSSQRGVGRQTVAPRSISIWFHAHPAPPWHERVGQRLDGPRRQPLAGDPRQHPSDVGVDDGDVALEGERQHGTRRVRPDPGQRQQRVEVVGQRAAVARRRPARPSPRCCAPDAGSRGPASAAARRRAAPPRTPPASGSRAERRPLRDHARHLRLLQHHLGDEDPPRIAGRPPRQVAQPRRAPRQHGAGIDGRVAVNARSAHPHGAGVPAGRAVRRRVGPLIGLHLALGVRRPDPDLVLAGRRAHGRYHWTHVSSLVASPSCAGIHGPSSTCTSTASMPVSGCHATPAIGCCPASMVAPLRGTSMREATLIGPSLDQPRGHPVAVELLPRHEVDRVEPLRRRHVAVQPGDDEAGREAVDRRQRLAVHRHGHHRRAPVEGDLGREAGREVVDRVADDLRRAFRFTPALSSSVFSCTPCHVALPTRLPPTSLETHCSVTVSSKSAIATSSS